MFGSLARHVKWFTDPRPYPTRYELLLTPPLVAAFAIAAVAVGAAALIQRRVPEPRIFRIFERFAGLGPLALGLHLGIALVACAVVGVLFVPVLRPERDAFGLTILAIEGICGVLLAIGLFTRPAAVALALLGVVAMQPFTFESILEQVHILGAAVFLFLVGRGAVSVDRFLGQHRSVPFTGAPAVALTLLRVAMGFGISFGALTEKLLNPALSNALLAERSYLNVFAGIGLGNDQFVYLAGVVEFAIGVVIISGQLTRPVMAVGAALFTMTLPVFGWSELLGHLPYYGIMLTLFITPSADPSRVQRQLRQGRLAA